MYVNAVNGSALGRFIDLRDKSSCWHGMHLPSGRQPAHRRRPQAACFLFVAELKYPHLVSLVTSEWRSHVLKCAFV